MLAQLTAQQFRLLWELTGGDAIHMPIQAPSSGRMISDRDRIQHGLLQWWAANEDAQLLESVRQLRLAGRWLALEAFAGGKPSRALLAISGADAVLAVQDPALAVREGEAGDWYPDSKVSVSGWSLERGGDVHISRGKVADLVGAMLSPVPVFAPGTSPALSAAESEVRAGAGALLTRATTSMAERITALLARPMAAHGSLTVSVSDGPVLREAAKLSWRVIEGDGGYRVDVGERVGVKPLRSGELATAALALLESVR